MEPFDQRTLNNVGGGGKKINTPLQQKKASLEKNLVSLRKKKKQKAKDMRAPRFLRCQEKNDQKETLANNPEMKAWRV